MRLWSLHPAILDQKGLGGAWHEGINKAQPALIKLLNGEAKLGVGAGYHNHAQLTRFLACDDPLAALGSWLCGIHEQACKRGYKYNKALILKPGDVRMSVTEGQLEYEFQHVQARIKARDRSKYQVNTELMRINPHPMFDVVPGEIEPWEKV